MAAHLGRWRMSSIYSTNRRCSKYKKKSAGELMRSKEESCAAVYNMEEAAERLHKSRRWLQDWLRFHPADSLGKPFYAQLGRTKVFTDESLSRLLAACMEDQRCRSSSSRRVRVGARIGG